MHISPVVPEYFLWKTAAGVCLLTPDRLLVLPDVDPPSVPETIPYQADASSWWPDFPWSVFNLHKSSCRLWLDKNLSESWQKFPFEAFHEEGVELEGNLNVIRYVHDYDLRLAPRKITKALVLDRWPDDGITSVLEAFVETEQVEIWRGNYVDQRLAGRPDLSHFDLLIILSHGGAGSELLVDELGQPWRPRLPDGLPRVVWLAACTDGLGELLTFAQDCLAKGARHVLAPEGMISSLDVANTIASMLNAENNIEFNFRVRRFLSAPLSGASDFLDARTKRIKSVKMVQAGHRNGVGSTADRLREIADSLEALDAISLEHIPETLSIGLREELQRCLTELEERCGGEFS